MSGVCTYSQASGSTLPGTWGITSDESEMNFILTELADLPWAAFVFSEPDSC